MKRSNECKQNPQKAVMLDLEKATARIYKFLILSLKSLTRYIHSKLPVKILGLGVCMFVFCLNCTCVM